MRRLMLAFRCFWSVLTRPQNESAVRGLLESSSPGEPSSTEAEPATKRPAPQPPAKPAAAQNPAITLLAALQREARLIDFLQEPLDQFDDAQIGAVVRDIHRDGAAVIERFFAIRPVDEQHSEGNRVELAPGFDPAEYQLTGSVAGDAGVSGTLQHQGWRATRCELPQWTGPEQAALIIAPAEVEVG